VKPYVLALAGLALIPSSSLGQSEVRLNKVWSTKIVFKTCGTTILTANIYDVLADGELTSPSRSRTDYFYFQWSQDLPLDKTSRLNYAIFDLLVDMGQEIKILHLTGVIDGTSRVFNKFIWISPYGYSNLSIPKAPKRKSPTSPRYSTEELQHLRFWLANYHQGKINHFWNTFGRLVVEFDASVEMPLNVSATSCKEASLGNNSYVKKEVFLRKEVSQ
jgi:hypothetical protein